MPGAVAFPAWHVHTSVWLVMAALAGGYPLLLRRFAVHATRGQKLAWAGGVLATWVAADWPLHDLAERYLYSAHMVQHLLLSLVAPPLFLLGTPALLARRLLRPRWALTTVRQLARPFIALVVFNTYIVFTHWPTIVDAGLRFEPIHFLLHAGLMVTAMFMWMPVLSPLPEIRRLSPPGQMLYLFLQSVVPTVPASFLVLSDGVIYRTYTRFPRLWGMSAIGDQRAAGIIMKLIGGLILWGFIATVFFRWAFREQEADRLARAQAVHRVAHDDEILTWHDVEAELARLGPGPSSPT